jgi:hypothetical protein
MSDWILQQQINLKFCVKLGSDTCTMLYEAYGGEATKNQVFMSGINDPRELMYCSL